MFYQYYYAHANKNFSTEGAVHFKEDGKIYGGDPVLIKAVSIDDRGAAAAQPKPAVSTTMINKFSWGDEEEKVKIYIETNQFKGTVTKEMVDVDFEEYLCDVRVTDEEGNVYIRNFYK